MKPRHRLHAGAWHEGQAQRAARFNAALSRMSDRNPLPERCCGYRECSALVDRMPKTLRFCFQAAAFKLARRLEAHGPILAGGVEYSASGGVIVQSEPAGFRLEA